jgi:hypothetical protein
MGAERPTSGRSAPFVCSGASGPGHSRRRGRGRPGQVAVPARKRSALDGLPKPLSPGPRRRPLSPASPGGAPRCAAAGCFLRCWSSCRRGAALNNTFLFRGVFLRRVFDGWRGEVDRAAGKMGLARRAPASDPPTCWVPSLAPRPRPAGWPPRRSRGTNPDHAPRARPAGRSPPLQTRVQPGCVNWAFANRPPFSPRTTGGGLPRSLENATLALAVARDELGLPLVSIT